MNASAPSRLFLFNNEYSDVLSPQLRTFVKQISSEKYNPHGGGQSTVIFLSVDFVEESAVILEAFCVRRLATQECLCKVRWIKKDLYLKNNDAIKLVFYEILDLKQRCFLYENAFKYY